MGKEKLYTWDYGHEDHYGDGGYGNEEIKLTVEDYITRYVRELNPIMDNMYDLCGDITISEMQTMFNLFSKMKRLMWDINKNKKYNNEDSDVGVDEMDYTEFVKNFKDKN